MIISAIRILHTMAISHKVNVVELSARPAFAHLDLSINMPTRPTANDTGGANIIRIPARIPKGEPHPKPGSPANCAPAASQGEMASQKLIFPIILDFILLLFLLENYLYIIIKHNSSEIIPYLGFSR